ncbi:MAG: tetratricopeptide repeat protein [Bacteroidota bacterium]
MKNIYFTGIFFLLLLNESASYAQDIAKVPGLKKKLAASKNSIDSVDNLAFLCYNYANSDPDKGLLYGDTALQLATSVKYEKGIADCYNNIGWLYYRKGDYEKAEAYLQNALTLFNKIGNPSYPPVACSNLGWVFLSKGDYPKALKYFLVTLNYAQSVHDTDLLGFHYYNIGVLYNRQLKTTEARKYFESALECFKGKKPEKLSNAYQSIGNTYSIDGDFDLAMTFYKKAYSYIDTTDHYKKGMIHENIGDLYSRQKKFVEALSEYHLAESQYIRTSLKEDIAYINNLIGDASHELHLTDDALNAYEKGLLLALEMKDKNMESRFYVNISSIYKEKQDFKKAFEYDQKADHLKDSLFTAERANDLLKLQTQFETENKEKENKILRAENEITTARLQRNRLSLFASIAGILILIFVGLLLRRNYHREKKHSSELNLLNEELKKQRNEIERINYQLEMKALRSQMNPHFIFNCLNSLQECILNGDVDKANNYLAKFSRLLRMILESSDEDFIPLSRELEMLDLYLTMEAGRMKGSFQYSVTVDPDIDDEEVGVPSLLLQPLVENAIWHGLAGKPEDRTLKVEIKQQQQHLVCIVEDNGVGRKNHSNGFRKHQSKGISILTERIRLLNYNHPESSSVVYDDITDEHQLPAGTRVSLQFPVND